MHSLSNFDKFLSLVFSCLFAIGPSDYIAARFGQNTGQSENITDL